nr:hypothetical protein [uncultured Roseococcus sp.]
MLVKQIKPGIRLRVQFLLESPPPTENIADTLGEAMMAKARGSIARLTEIEIGLTAAGMTRDGGGE